MVLVLTAEEEWSAPGCRGSCRSRCCPPSPGPGAEQRRREEGSEGGTTLVSEGANRQGQRAAPAADALH